MCLDQLEVQGTDLHPMYRRDEGHFPGRPFSLFCVSLVGMLALVQFNFSRAHRLVLSPSYPLFSLPMKTLLYIFFFLKSPIVFQPNHFLPLCKVLYLCLSPAFIPLQLRNVTFQSVNHSGPLPPLSSVLSLPHNTAFFSSLPSFTSQLILTS